MVLVVQNGLGIPSVCRDYCFFGAIAYRFASTREPRVQIMLKGLSFSLISLRVHPTLRGKYALTKGDVRLSAILIPAVTDRHAAGGRGVASCDGTVENKRQHIARLLGFSTSPRPYRLGTHGSREAVFERHEIRPLFISFRSCYDL